MRGEIFNLCYQNLRISELALRVREALRGLGIEVDLRPEYHHGGVRNYLVSYLGGPCCRVWYWLAADCGLH